MSDIEYFYAAHSGFAYLGSQRFLDIAKAADRRIAHKPFDLGQVIQATGAGGFRERTPAHRAYYFGREIERWSEYRSAPVLGKRPTYHDNDVTLANTLLIAASRMEPGADLLAHQMLEAHWRDDADLANGSTLEQLVSAANLDWQALSEAASTDLVQSIYADNTREAIDRSVFGSPTYFVEGDMFYGQDHLELVERALRQPFEGIWPRQN